MQREWQIDGAGRVRAEREPVLFFLSVLKGVYGDRWPDDIPLAELPRWKCPQPQHGDPKSLQLLVEIRPKSEHATLALNAVISYAHAQLVLEVSLFRQRLRQCLIALQVRTPVGAAHPWDERYCLHGEDNSKGTTEPAYTWKQSLFDVHRSPVPAEERSRLSRLSDVMGGALAPWLKYAK